MKHAGNIISFDLYRSAKSEIDVSRFFPISPLHAIRSTKPLLDTIREKRSIPLDLSIPRILSIPRLRSFETLDIADPSLASRRGLSHSDTGESYTTIDLFPPLSIPYGALDVRGESVVSSKKYADIYRRSLPWSLHARRMRKESLRYLSKKRRPIIITLSVILGLSIPIILYTKSLIEHAYADLLSLRDTKSETEIASLIHASRGNFERANVLFFPFRILPGENIHLARTALDGGLALSRGLDHIVSRLPESLSGSMISKTLESGDSLYRPTPTDIRPLIALGIDEPTAWLRANRESVMYLADSLRDAGSIYSEAASIDHPRAAEIAHIGRGLSKFSELLEYYTTHESDILALLGADTPERYIILNQNRDEIRANGGFPGSVITFTVFRGNIEDFRTDDVYYYDWNLYPFRELPPPGLALLSDNYGLRDVNYYPDFRETLEKANAFIEKSGDPTVTIGVAIHQGLIEDMLSTIGPVTLSGVIEPFRADNFSLLMSLLVESRYDEETSSKDILRKFVDAFILKVHEKRAYEEVFSLLDRYRKNGEILFASRNESIDRYLSTLRKPLPWEVSSLPQVGVSAESPPALSYSGASVSGPNWAYPLLTSLSGNKSDRLIERTYTAETTRAGACTYTNKLTFTHKHTYTKKIEQEIRRYLALLGIRDTARVEKMLAIQGNGKNSTYMRILVPKGSTLTGSTAGIEVSDTDTAREFAFTLDTPIGSTASKTFRYTIDIPGCRALDIPVSWYRQPGLERTTLESR